MSEERTATAKKRKWGAYICPSCHSIFRLPTSSKSQASRCPNCADYIHITPRAENKIAPWNPDQQTLSEQAQEAQSKTQRTSSTNPANKAPGTKRRKQRKTNSLTNWDSTTEQATPSPPASKKPWAIVCLLSILSMAAPLILLTKHNQINSLKAKITDPSSINQLPPSQLSSTETPDKSIPEENLTKIRSINDSIALCTKAITPFLEASSIEEALPYINDRERVEPLLRSHHKKNPYVKRGLNKVISERGARISGNNYTLRIVTSDYKTDSIICVDQGDETFLVDWESWVGYSELTQSELRKQQPTRPIAIRAIAIKTNYYNFQFADETKWQAYEISTKDSDEILYGYVTKTSQTHLDLNKFVTETKSSALQLKVRYPDSNKRASQVLIDSVICNGWVNK